MKTAVSLYTLALTAALCGLATASPVSTAGDDATVRGLETQEWSGGLVGGITGPADELTSHLLGSIGDAAKADDRERVIDLLRSLEPKRSPSTEEEAIAIIEKIYKSGADSIIERQAQLIANGLVSGTVEDLFEYASGFAEGENGHDNDNPEPPTSVYPQAEPCDAPYSIPESDLRSAIFIPETFTYGEKLPVILFPGTGSTGYIAYRGNLIPLLTDSDWADPVWVNVPGLMLDDAQNNSEYAAYAINYIASLSGRNVSIVSWSQGCPDTQWALKYWPSTRGVTSDHIAVSGDYKGSLIADAASLSVVLSDPSVVQQRTGSSFIETLRSDGGDSAYVPTTTVYTATDLIVQPQSGRGASAYMLDERSVGVLNAQTQVVCKGRPAGSIHTHENMLGNPLTVALVEDALTHEGPGDLSRLELDEVCGSYQAPGLELGDLLVTESVLAVAAFGLALYLPKAVVEPRLKEYAAAPVACPQEVSGNHTIDERTTVQF